MKLPRNITISQLLVLSEPLTGEVQIAELDRLHPFLGDISGEVAIEVSLQQDDEQRRYLLLCLDTVLIVTCQRCLEHFSLAMTSTEQEPDMIIENEDIDLYEIIIDELILSLPAVVAHPPGACKIDLIKTYADAAAKPHPFDILKKLKK